MKLPNWPALLLAPSLALASQSVIYALVTPSCKVQTMLAPHVVSALTLLVCAMFTWIAWHNWRTAPAPEPEDTAARRPAFVAMVACLVGAISCLVVLAMWFPQWVLSPCAS
jgi:hypothetical protein